VSQTTFPSLRNDAQVAKDSGSIEIPAALESAIRCIPRSGLVQMSFDLHDASEEDYVKFYNALAKIGLLHWVKGNIGKLELPHSAVIGDFTGISVEDVRDRVRTSVVQILEAIGLKGFMFVAVGENGTWGSQEVS